MWWTPKPTRVPGSILAVDPSLSCTGWAYARAGELVACGVIPTSTRSTMRTRISTAARVLQGNIGRPDLIVIEWPQIYQRERAKRNEMGASERVDPNDMLFVAGVASTVLHEVPSDYVLAPKPADWKGQVKKLVHNARVIRNLTPAELAVLNAAEIPKSQANNAIDAIGLLKWAQRIVAAEVSLGDRAANMDQETAEGDRGSAAGSGTRGGSTP